MYKRWPVGSRAQSAIRAALALRASIPTGLSIASVTIRTHREVVAHLLRPESFRPVSRETADHSLPYITCVALCEGDVRFGDFDEPTAWRRSDVAGLLEGTKVEVIDDERSGFVCGYPTQVAVTLSDGSVLAEDAAVPPDALSAGAMASAIDGKWSAFADRRLGSQVASRAHDLMTDLRSVQEVRTLTAALSG
jgi:2-methylcitrate dehydratase